MRSKCQGGGNRRGNRNRNRPMNRRDGKGPHGQGRRNRGQNPNCPRRK